MCAAPSTSRSAASSAAQRGVVEDGRAAAEADLVEPHARADQDREGARRDLGVERAGVARLDAVELGAAVGDEAGEEVEPAGRALGVGDGGDAARAGPGPRPAARRRRSPSPAPRRRRGRCGASRSRPAARRAAPAPGRKEARTRNASRAEAEVEARRLDLAGRERRRGGDRTRRRCMRAMPCAGIDAGPVRGGNAGVWSG